jgi:hypothetical protein
MAQAHVFALGTALLLAALVAIARARARASRARSLPRVMLALGLALQFVAIGLDLTRDSTRVDARETQIQAATDPGCNH